MKTSSLQEAKLCYQGAGSAEKRLLRARTRSRENRAFGRILSRPKMHLHSAGNLLHLGMPAQRIKGEVTSSVGLKWEAFVFYPKKEGSSDGHQTCKLKMTSSKCFGDELKDVLVEKPRKLVLHVELPGASEQGARNSVINRPRQTQKSHTEPHMTNIV